MSGPLIATSLESFSARLRPALDWAARERIDAVELDARRQVVASNLGATARRQIRHLLSERDLSLSGLMFPLRGGIAAIDRLDDRIASLTQACELAYALGTKHVVVPFVLPEEDEVERTVDVLANVAQSADHIGAILTLRLGADAAAIGELLRDAASSAPIAVQFDPASCVTAGDRLEDSVRLLADCIEQFRVMDVVKTSRGSGRETAVGRGEVDFELLAALSHELPIRAVVVSPDDPKVAPLADATAYARAVFGHHPIG